MPAFSFEKIPAPVYGVKTVDTSVLKQQHADTRNDSAVRKDSPRKRGMVINWLDRLVERRIEKVERDIERASKIAGPTETH